MNRHLDARRIHLDQSRRSSPAIIDVVNKIFTAPEMQPLLPGFKPHSTHLEDAWGLVEVWPLVTGGDSEEIPGTNDLRNPLETARPNTRDLRYYREGQLIAGRIQQLVRDQIAEYGDILVLMRSRTHLADYETALREHAIPYLSRDRGSLLESLEIRDMEALLTVLMTPQDNLALAQVLRSPLFSLDESVLCELSRPVGGVWLDRLTSLAALPDCDVSIRRAASMLSHWRGIAGRIPIHDLLEQIFQQANVTERYRAAVHTTQAAQVEANLGRFIELALEVDSGRYPTLPRFLERVKRLRGLDKEGLGKATPDAGQQRVNLLTIHASKGLEAPVVFLCDTTSQGSPTGTTTLVRWPADADRPTDFLLPGNTSQRDSITSERLELERAEDTRESANLLYVALTRARNMLIVSGCQPARGDQSGWYGQICRPLCGTALPDTVWQHRSGEPARKITSSPELPDTEVRIDKRLQQPIRTGRLWHEISPSHSTDDSDFYSGDKQGKLRGIIIHRILQLTADQKFVNDAIIERIAKEQGTRPDDSLLASCRDEVQALYDNDELGWLFPKDSLKRDEVPVQYKTDGRTVYGIIDRLLVTDSTVHLIDYKSHRITDTKILESLAEHYRPQLVLYREAAKRLWPEHEIRCYLLFTHSATLKVID